MVMGNWESSLFSTLVLISGIHFVSGSGERRLSDLALPLAWGLFLLQLFQIHFLFVSRRKGLQNGVLPALLVLATAIAVGTLSDPRGGFAYFYQERERLRGTWLDPNTLGLFAGIGIIITIGILLSIAKRKPIQTGSVQGHTSRINIFFVFWSSIILVVLVYGLLFSYSRGAWLGTITGLIWLGLRGTSFQSFHEESGFLSQLKNRRRILLCFIIVTGFVFSIGIGQFSEHSLLRRVASIGNTYDFSWRNRLSSYNGSLRMISDKPLIGWGSADLQTVYWNYYKPKRIVEPEALKTNDFFRIGPSFGFPFLCLFAGGLFFRVFPHCNSPRSTQNSAQEASYFFHRFQTISRSALIVLIFGFWFNGGLFEIPLASLFWLLMAFSGNMPAFNCAVSEGD